MSAALAKHIGKLPEELRRSLTWDQGKEMHAHKRFTVATNVQVYFCDPRSPEAILPLLALFDQFGRSAFWSLLGVHRTCTG